jgi:hypothetical protein
MKALPLEVQTFSELLCNERLLLYTHPLRRAFCCQIIFMSWDSRGETRVISTYVDAAGLTHRSSNQVDGIRDERAKTAFRTPVNEKGI